MLVVYLPVSQARQEAEPTDAAYVLSGHSCLSATPPGQKNPGGQMMPVACPSSVMRLGGSMERLCAHWNTIGHPYYVYSNTCRRR